MKLNSPEIQTKPISQKTCETRFQFKIRICLQIVVEEGQNVIKMIHKFNSVFLELKYRQPITSPNDNHFNP